MLITWSWNDAADRTTPFPLLSPVQWAPPSTTHWCSSSQRATEESPAPPPSSLRLSSPQRTFTPSGRSEWRLVDPLHWMQSDGLNQTKGRNIAKWSSHRCTFNLPSVSLSCSFNPIAHTSMVKTLQKVASSECQKTGTSKKTFRGQRKEKFHIPPKEVVENLAESSAGDIRSAINALQFACLKG